jgi:hypothetical protein
MFSKVRVTELVPAPDDPVMAMMGCFSDKVFSLNSCPHQAPGRPKPD